MQFLYSLMATFSDSHIETATIIKGYRPILTHYPSRNITLSICLWIIITTSCCFTLIFYILLPRKLIN